MNLHIFTNPKDNTLLRDFEVALNKSHHLYDFVQMTFTNIEAQAMSTDKFWNTIHHQRVLFTSISSVDYALDNVIDDWRNDYKNMQSSIINSEKSSFEKLMGKVNKLKNLLHT